MCPICTVYVRTPVYSAVYTPLSERRVTALYTGRIGSFDFHPGLHGPGIQPETDDGQASKGGSEPPLEAVSGSNLVSFGGPKALF